ncbi:MAG TPA: hypothetical protein VM689_06665 [Aliidongia sp.]|nr:hypothetical protein [Aliidongia sp.]
MSAVPASRAAERRICIGLDLDNTIIDYRRLFVEVGASLRLVPADFRGDKTALRSAVRALSDGERLWTALQAEVYGARIMGARMMPGALAFIRRAVATGLPTFIVSHKTRRPAADPDGVDLHEAARAWLDHHGVIGPGALQSDNVFFEATRAEKIARIRALRCTTFIDDLVEMFEDEQFPEDVDKLLLAEDGAGAGAYRIISSWAEAETHLLTGLHYAH